MADKEKPNYEAEIKAHFAGDRTLLSVYVFGDGSYTFSKSIAEKNAKEGIKYKEQLRADYEVKKEKKEKEKK